MPSRALARVGMLRRGEVQACLPDAGVVKAWHPATALRRQSRYLGQRCDPAGVVRVNDSTPSGGVAALNSRLMATTPVGVGREPRTPHVRGSPRQCHGLNLSRPPRLASRGRRCRFHFARQFVRSSQRTLFPSPGIHAWESGTDRICRKRPSRAERPGDGARPAEAGGQRRDGGVEDPGMNAWAEENDRDPRWPQ